MKLNEALFDAARDKGLIQELNFIPEAENVIQGGSNYIFESLWDLSDSQKTYDPGLFKKCCGYLFGKGVEATISWGQTKDGKFTIFYDPKHLIDMDLRAEVPSQYIPYVQDACPYGTELYQPFLEWCASCLEDPKQDIDLKNEFRNLFVMCSRIGIAYALERGLHSLPGSEKGPVYREPIYDQEVYGAAEAGFNYYQGKEVPRDLKKALLYLTKAAECGHIGAQYGLGMMFYRGEGTIQDHRMALRWLLKAAENGNAQAQHEVSVFFFNGVGCDPDFAKAFYWCQKAADQNLAESIYNLALFYSNGKGVKKDPEKAISYIRRAAEMGHQDAKEAMKRLGIR